MSLPVFRVPLTVFQLSQREFRQIWLILSADLIVGVRVAFCERGVQDAYISPPNFFLFRCEASVWWQDEESSEEEEKNA